MRIALMQLGEDFLSSFVFLGIYLATRNLPLAVGFALAIGIGQLALAKWRRHRLETMQWLSLALVITLGAATLITNDSRFMMAKPSLIHFAIGAVMLRPGWLDRYMPPIVKEHLPKGVLKLAGYAWAGLMFLLGLVNLYVAANFSPIVWGYFLAFGATGAKVVAFLIQYFVFRFLIVRDIAAHATATITPQANNTKRIVV